MERCQMASPWKSIELVTLFVEMPEIPAKKKQTRVHEIITSLRTVRSGLFERTTSFTSIIFL